MPCSAVDIAPATLHLLAMFPAQAAYPVSHRLHDEVRLGHHASPEHLWETLLVYAALYGRGRTSRHVRVRRRRMPVSGYPDHLHVYAGALSLMLTRACVGMMGSSANPAASRSTRYSPQCAPMHPNASAWLCRPACLKMKYAWGEGALHYQQSTVCCHRPTALSEHRFRLWVIPIVNHVSREGDTTQDWERASIPTPLDSQRGEALPKKEN